MKARFEKRRLKALQRQGWQMFRRQLDGQPGKHFPPRWRALARVPADIRVGFYAQLVSPTPGHTRTMRLD